MFVHKQLLMNGFLDLCDLFHDEKFPADTSLAARRFIISIRLFISNPQLVAGESSLPVVASRMATLLKAYYAELKNGELRKTSHTACMVVVLGPIVCTVVSVKMGVHVPVFEVQEVEFTVPLKDSVELPDSTENLVWYLVRVRINLNNTARRRRRRRPWIYLKTNPKKEDAACCPLPTREWRPDTRRLSVINTLSEPPSLINAR